ncbi:pentatricopeptide repeat-containing protein At1g56690, mitochondrial-like isoform X2 [Dioscorea cayenensis subsp. rotundata]|uniref:Pentatricopeptide repeat-containing protein At1g56690, mitochondrial-like isoform X2 n=1 Tax=Dioscorea cayennensis subsp. rotundata TaxID=55577 RepID=A0AB40BC22_DIOCR|nr:pentatricopeptide repeat-containing protein At1g56690, mitochondrial-like isoform X2 [Dioscorea cayenensis subsp. rotundata]
MEIMKSSLKLLASCASLRALKQIHAHMFLNGLHHDNYVAVQLLSFCSRELREVGYARMIFNSLAHSANVFLWTAMITSYSNHQTGTMREAFTIYKLMQQQGPSPNKFTLSSVLKACSSLQAVAEGYAGSGNMLAARELFHLMSERGINSWNALVAGYTHNGECWEL